MGVLSTIDADSDGEEGHYYVMSMDEVQWLLIPTILMLGYRIFNY